MGSETVFLRQRVFWHAASAIVPTPVTKTPHDALFKSAFQQPENAAAELQHVFSDGPRSARGVRPSPITS